MPLQRTVDDAHSPKSAKDGIAARNEVDRGVSKRFTGGRLEPVFSACSRHFLLLHDLERRKTVLLILVLFRSESYPRTAIADTNFAIDHIGIERQRQTVLD
jgi:hypothetical protein